MQFLITYRPELDHTPELVEADTLHREGGHLVLRGTALVMNRPRSVVVRRIRQHDVVSVSEAGPAASD